MQNRYTLEEIRAISAAVKDDGLAILKCLLEASAARDVGDDASFNHFIELAIFNADSIEARYLEIEYPQGSF